MTAQFRLHDSGKVLVITHDPGPPDDPYRDARRRVIELLDLDKEQAADLYALGDWLGEREP